MSETATFRATEALRTLVFDGSLPPGSDHLEGELAQRLQMSRTPVREALTRLEAQGLVTLRPRRGARIVGLSPSDMNDIYEVLTALESTAAARAAARGLDADALDPMQRAIADMDAALALGDLVAWAAADEAFHSELVAASGNRHLMDGVALYSDQVRRARMVTLNLRPLPHQSNADHSAVLQAIRDCDSDGAYQLHYAHREHARLLLTNLLRKHQLTWV